LYILVLLFVANDAWIYKTPIAKITHVKEEQTASRKAVRGGKELYYKQTMEARILNGTEKGQNIVLKNTYTSSMITGQKYHKGDKVLLNSNGGKSTGTIKTLKRDTYLAAIFGVILFLLIGITKKQGLRTIFTMIVNLVIYSAGFLLYLRGYDILRVCNVLAVVFTLVTIFFLTGLDRKTVAAILSTLCVLALIMGIFLFTMNHTAALDYSMMEYLGSTEHPEDVFVAEVLFAGLGAIMDVAVTLSAAMGELIRKKPDISIKKLYLSGREVGYDIMGTMISVLLFTFAAGLIPSFLIRMNNEVAFFTNVRLYIPFEISRFLIESIGIVAAIPISIVVASALFKLQIGERKMIGVLALVLFLLLILIGGDRGAVAVLALCGNIAVLAFTVILLANGAPPFLVIFAATLSISYITLLKQNGNNLKTRSALLSVALIMFALSICIYLGVWKTGSGGLNEIQMIQEDVQLYYTMDIDIHMQQIAAGIVILSALGAVMDTALSVTSAVYEVSVHKSGLDRREYFHSGLQVGKDIIGTTVNTLLFAYFGESMMMFAYLQQGKYNLEMVLNSKFLFQGLAMMFVGVIACLLAVPISAWTVSQMLTKEEEKNDKSSAV